MKQFFKQLKINDTFEKDGSLWRKQSTRTAHLVSIPNRWFYFGLNEYCNIPTIEQYKNEGITL